MQGKEKEKKKKKTPSFNSKCNIAVLTFFSPLHEYFPIKGAKSSLCGQKQLKNCKNLFKKAEKTQPEG